MKRAGTAILGVLALGAVFATTASAQYGYYPEPPSLARPNGYVYDQTRGWQPRPSFFGGYNTGSFEGRGAFYRRASPAQQWPYRDTGPRYSGFGPGIGEYRNFGGGDFYSR
jgi:hypothetical protein